MFKYKIIEILYDASKGVCIEALSVKVVKSFLGPGVLIGNFGLYAGDTMDMFVLYYQDSQDKMQLTYLGQPFEEYTIVGVEGKPDETFDCFDASRKRSASPEDALLSKHSPNF